MSMYLQSSLSTHQFLFRRQLDNLRMRLEKTTTLPYTAAASLSSMQYQQVPLVDQNQNQNQDQPVPPVASSSSSSSSSSSAAAAGGGVAAAGASAASSPSKPLTAEDSQYQFFGSGSSGFAYIPYTAVEKEKKTVPVPSLEDLKRQFQKRREANLSHVKDMLRLIDPSIML